MSDDYDYDAEAFAELAARAERAEAALAEAERELVARPLPDRAEVERLAKAYASYEPGALRALLDYVCGPEPGTEEEAR